MFDIQVWKKNLLTNFHQVSRSVQVRNLEHQWPPNVCHVSNTMRILVTSTPPNQDPLTIDPQPSTVIGQFLIECLGAPTRITSPSWQPLEPKSKSIATVSHRVFGLYGLTKSSLPQNHFKTTPKRMYSKGAKKGTCLQSPGWEKCGHHSSYRITISKGVLVKVLDLKFV